MRADRLLTIMLLLQKNKQMTAQDLADELEVSLRTIYRDIDALSFAGIPVYTQPGHNGGIFLDQDYQVSLTDLSKNQSLSLMLAANVRPLADIGMDEAVKAAQLKVFHKLPEAQQFEIRRFEQRFLIDSEGWFEAGDVSNFLEIIQQAIWHDQRLVLTYQTIESSPYQLKVDAYALASKAYNWYLIGRKDSGDFRTYRLTRIKQILPTGETFDRDPSFDLKRYWQISQQSFQQQMAETFPGFTVDLSVHSSVYWYLAAVLEGQFQQISHPDEDQWSRVSVHFQTDYEATAHILAMGKHVKIISPAELRNQIKNVVLGLSKHYNLND